MVIKTSVLREHLNDPSWVIFDCRHDLMDHGVGPKAYAAGHIPGAYFAPVETALAGAKTGKNGRHPLPEPDAFASFLQQHGVTENSQIVGYDDAGGLYAARLWWLARWIGLSRVGVLDGGFPKWVADGHPVTKEIPSPREGRVVAQPDQRLLVNVGDVAAGVKSRNMVVIDARAPERFRGDVEPIDRVGGHIPSARNRFFKTNLNSDSTLRSAAELKTEFTTLLAGSPPTNVVHQCGSGITACANLFAMEYAGLAGSKLYPGSWSEWISDPSRPIAKGS